MFQAIVWTDTQALDLQSSELIHLDMALGGNGRRGETVSDLDRCIIFVCSSSCIIISGDSIYSFIRRYVLLWMGP
jgi:hypothetical protein